MNEEDIQRAVEAIMLWRPESKVCRMASSQRLEVKRRVDE